MPVPFSTKIRRPLAILFVALMVLALPAWQHFAPVTTGPGWNVRVYLDDVPLVSGLARDDAGALYITHEQNRQRGSLTRQLPDGTIQEVMAGLDKPDGLVAFRQGILISQEGGDYPVLWLKDGRGDKLFAGRDIEGIDTDGQVIYAIEDVKSEGRLLRHDVATGQTSTLRAGLEEAEGVAICPDGRLFYSEKKRRWIKQYRKEGSEDPIVLAGLNAPGFLMCDLEGLWVAEDATHGARLLLLDFAGPARVVLEHLRSAQTVLALAPGRLLVAEQGRHRILEINRTDHGPQ